MKTTPPTELINYGCVKRGASLHFSYDPVTYIPVFDRDNIYIEDTYGSECPDGRVHTRQVEESGAMTVPKPHTDELEHGRSLEVINISRDTPLVFCAFGPMLQERTKTIYMAPEEKYQELLESPENRFSPELGGMGVEVNYVRIIWEDTVVRSPRSPGASGEYKEICVSPLDSETFSRFQLEASEVESLLSAKTLSDVDSPAGITDHV
jgi:hypothetical protein